MCDTMIACPVATDSGAMLFAKNSDRQRHEAQGVEYFPKREYREEETLSCTYITIPQARRTHAVLLCRPCWIWGAEMGANSFGVAIGNEGLHSKSPAPRQDALLGMDLLRLGLERATTAAEAIEVMTILLETYGQGGNCGHVIPDYYHNGFMVTDSREAFVLETVGREWIVQRVEGVRAISNRYSIARADAWSPGLGPLLRKLGSDSFPPEDFADAIRNPDREHVGYAAVREARAQTRLETGQGHLTVADMSDILRDHGTEGAWHPAREPRRTICAHATTEDRPGQTVGAMVSEIFTGHAIHWVTASAAPCLSIFKPLFIDDALPSLDPPLGLRPTDQFNDQMLWWSHERLHRRALRTDFEGFLKHIRMERDAIERQFRDRAGEVAEGNVKDRMRVVLECWKEARELEDRWLAEIMQWKPSRTTEDDAAYLAAWRIPGEIPA